MNDTSTSAARLVIGHSAWTNLVRELHLRGHGERESGAFLLASAVNEKSPTPRHITRIVYYDDLDSGCLTGGISLSGTAYDQLWMICSRDQLTVVADVHTHPGSSVTQSYIDATNPMIALPGHMAVIIPRYAKPPVAVGEVGIHRYDGHHQWTRLTGDSLQVWPPVPPRRRRMTIGGLFDLVRHIVLRLRKRGHG